MKSWPNVKKLVDICVFSLPNENKFPKRIGSSAAMSADDVYSFANAFAQLPQK
jgi:hypothetical protein